MTKECTSRVYDIMGLKVKASGESEEDAVSPEELVKYVQKKIDHIKRNKPEGVDEAHVFLLAALNIAHEKFKIEQNYQDDLSQVYTMAREVFHLVQDSPAPSQ